MWTKEVFRTPDVDFSKPESVQWFHDIFALVTRHNEGDVFAIDVGVEAWIALHQTVDYKTLLSVGMQMFPGLKSVRLNRDLDKWEAVVNSVHETSPFQRGYYDSKYTVNDV